MKIKVFLVKAFILTITLLLAACESEEEKRPQIFLSKSNITGEPGQPVFFDVSVKSKYNLKEIKVTPDVLGDNNIYSYKFKRKKKTNKFKYTYTIPKNIQKDKVKVAIKVFNKKTTYTKNAYISVNRPKYKITETSHVLGSYNNLNAPSFFSAQTGKSYFIDSAKMNSSEVDFVYFKGVKNGITLASPIDNTAASVYHNSKGLKSWSTQNSTKFVLTNISENQFDNITAKDIENEASKASNTKVTNITSGSVIAFVNASGQKGLIKVSKHSNSSKVSVLVKLLSK